MEGAGVVLSEMATDCTEVYLPAAGVNVGAETAVCTAAAAVTSADPELPAESFAVNVPTLVPVVDGAKLTVVAKQRWRW